MIESLEQLRKDADKCETAWIRKSDLLKDLDAIEREVESNYIELPEDANGEVWRVGDLVMGEVNPNYPKRVERMLWYGPDSGWQLETDTIIYPCPERSRHHKPPTVEDVLEEMYDMLDDARIPNGSEKRSHEQIIAEYAQKLRLANNEE